MSAVAAEGADVAVVIVSWRVRELLAGCLDSLLAEAKDSALRLAIHVVDSASGDGTPELVRSRFPSVVLHAESENIGFTRGNNLALRALGYATPGASAPPLVWLLNPDTRVQAGALRRLVEFMRQTPRCGLAGPRLENPDGSLQMGAFAFPGLAQLLIETQPRLARLRESRLDGRYPAARFGAGAPFEIGFPLGAAMLARAEAVRQVGLLDEGYEMYCEEVDWALRMARAGWQRWCVPGAVVTHYGGASSSQASARAEAIKWRSRRRYYRKHYGPLARGLALRLAAGR